MEKSGSIQCPIEESWILGRKRVWGMRLFEVHRNKFNKCLKRFRFYIKFLMCVVSLTFFILIYFNFLSFILFPELTVS